MDSRLIGPVAEEYARLRVGLLAAYPELAEDIEALADTLDGISSAQDIVRALIRDAIEDKAMAEAVAGLARDYTDRKNYLETRAEKRRLAALRLMQAMEERTIKAPEFTVSVRAVPPKVEVYDEEALPEPFWTYQTIRKLDRDRLKEALDQGVEVPGARRTNGGETISVRS